MEELKFLCFGGFVKTHKYSPEDIEARSDDPRIHPQKRILTPFLLDKKPPPIPSQEERTPFPFRRTNVISEALYLWCLPILKVGYRRTIQPEDLYIIPKGHTYDVGTRTDTFMRHFYQKKNKFEIEYLKKKKIEDTPENREALKSDPDFKYPPYFVLSSLYATFKRDYTIAVIYKLLGDAASGLNTLQIRALINYVNKKTNGIPVDKSGYGLAVGLAIMVYFVGMMYAHYFNDTSFCGAEMKGVLTKALLDKSFRLSKESKKKYPPAKVTALLGNDLSKIDLSANFFPFILGMPVGITISIVLLCVNLGGASVSGFGWFLLVTGFIVYSTKYLMKWRKEANIFTDARVTSLKEILGNMKMIKYYAWEIPFKNLLKDYRNDEMNVMLKIQFFRNIITGVAVTLPMCSALVGFLAMYGQLKGLKSAANIFSSLTLFNILTMHVALLPTALSSSGDAWVAFQRVQEYLLTEEETLDPNYHTTHFNEKIPAIQLDDASFVWDTLNNDSDSESLNISTGDEEIKEKSITEKTQNVTDEKGYSLQNINLSIFHNEFIVITGGIGSGKSSLLSAIQGSMVRTDGSVKISGNLVLCSQPWIQNTTVRDNITFGLPFDRDVYDLVIDACALPSDFDILPAGDKTEIGERGVNLSGGQKARINLARAVYRTYTLDEVNIIMLDDVLSAVDAKVGKHIMQNCIMGILKNKTRVLATHQLSLIGNSDRIIYMNGSGSIEIGTSTELLNKSVGFKGLMDFQMEKTQNQDEDNIDEEEEDIAVKEQELKLIKKQTTKDESKGRLIEKESIRENGIPVQMLWEYVKSGSGKVGPVFIICNLILAIIFTSFCMLFENVWLSFWSTKKFPQLSDGFYIGFYVLFTILFVLCAIWQFCTIVFITNRSSTLLNIKALNNIMHAPMSFFDTTPMGRIINRFTKDTDVLDNEIAEQTRLACFGFGNMCGVLILCIIFVPWFAICVPFIFAYLISTFSYYQSTAREIKRLEGVSRSLVFSNFDEVLQGMETIKLYSADERFIEKNNQNINTMNESYLLAVSMQRWFAVSLHGCSASLNIIISMLCVSRAYPISAAASGLLISYLVQFSMQIISFAKSMGQVEQYLSSVERICEYALELPQEAAYHTKDISPEFNPSIEELKTNMDLRPYWPENGNIQFKNISLRYRPDLPLVLKNLTLDIAAGSKIGICGRTGAGKSTIMTALYRLSEPEGGEMLIDNVNLQELGLFELRSRLSIIPQDPILFKGNVRKNLDPFSQLSDDQLLKALRMACGLNKNSPVEDLGKFGLDMTVEDNGSNFSLGERQVLALCRALVRDSKVLILDEATSSVDYETDARIQQTIKKGFKDCTILCIAHRLKTILDYDKILVMDKGEAVEFDTPKKLWLQGGIFKQMCDKSGIEEFDF